MLHPFFIMAFATCVPTVFDKRHALPVDAMISDPIFTSAHAITINAPPEQVWPWIAQMGSGRAGWYSWDAIDNGGRPSSTSIVPALQTVIPGDIMPAVPGAQDAFVVAIVDPPRDLVLTVPDSHGGHAVVWEHVMEPLDGGRTHLMVRGGLPRTGLISPGGSRLPVTGASSSTARMPCSRDYRIRCSSASPPSVTGSWKRGTCAASGVAPRLLRQAAT